MTDPSSAAKQGTDCDGRCRAGFNGKKSFTVGRVHPSARAHWRYDGNFIAILDGHACLAFGRLFLDIHIVKVDGQRAAFQDFVLDAGILVVQNRGQFGDEHGSGKEVVLFAGVGCRRREVEESEVSVWSFRRGHLRGNVSSNGKKETRVG